MPARRWLAVVAGLGLAFPAAAVAQEKGVTVDPKSPAGKEYAIPLDRARDEANGGKSPAGGSRPGSGAGGSAARGGGSRAGAGGRGESGLFGAGISRPGKSSRRSATAPRLKAKKARAAVDASSGGGSSPALPVTGLALAVLAAGGLIALGARRLGGR